ncbi:hypothetical protein PTKIN_Ptkin06aG0044500 [Pterospermum kingtungense]
MARCFLLLSLILVLLMANMAFARMLMVEGNDTSKEKDSSLIPMEGSEADNVEPGINNHHSIPRKSWDSSQQHGPSNQNPANDQP